MALDARKNRILSAVVDGYVLTAEPIGSEWLAAHYDFGCKSATLRNEMAELSEQGYLAQPHTSAGRVPTRQGYRYYVDRLLPVRPVPPPPRERLTERGCDVDAVLLETCRLLADMTQYPSVASPPTRKVAALRRVYLTAASPRHILLVMLLSTGHVEHRVLEYEGIMDPAVLAALSCYANTRLASCDLSEAAAQAPWVAPPELKSHQALLARLQGAIQRAARDLVEDHLFVEGASHILRQREFQDVNRLEELLQALEQESALIEVFSQAYFGQDVTVIVGIESRFPAMQDCSVITSPYYIADRVGGFIGVLGPQRMRYGEAVAAVGQVARALSQVLTQVSYWT